MDFPIENGGSFQFAMLNYQRVTKTPKVSRLVRFFLGCACTFLRARQYLPARRCHQASRRSRKSLWMADRDSHHLGSDIPSKSSRKPKKTWPNKGFRGYSQALKDQRPGSRQNTTWKPLRRHSEMGGEVTAGCSLLAKTSCVRWWGPQTQVWFGRWQP